MSYQKPQTIEELKAFARDNRIPTQQLRFFIGQDYQGAKAFGIYQAENGEYVVYKNKADGTRAVRYRGDDEAYAVNELYEKLKEEFERKRLANGAPSGYAHHALSSDTVRTSPDPDLTPDEYDAREQARAKASTRGTLVTVLVLMTIIMVFYMVLVIMFHSLSRIGSSRTYQSRDNQHYAYNYYAYDDDLYYHLGSSWYMYDNAIDSWIYVPYIDDAFAEAYDDYYYDGDYYTDYGASSFADTDYYEDYYDSYSSSYDDDWDYSSSYDDYDWDWDSGSDWDWDSGSDWDSDW